MCSHYQAIKECERYARHFGVEPPVDVGKYDVWLCYPASYNRRPSEADGSTEWLLAQAEAPAHRSLLA